MKHLQLPDGRKLLLPVLPMDATDIMIGSFINSEHECGLYYNIAYIQHEIPLRGLKDNYSILGYIDYSQSKPVFSEEFDAAPFVSDKVRKSFVHVKASDRALQTGQRNHFISRLNAEADTWFVNPLGEEPSWDAYNKKFDTYSMERIEPIYSKDLAAWRAAEEKVVRGKLLVILKG